jgi:hypothetical protein
MTLPNGFNFSRKALKKYIHMNFFTYSDIQKPSYKYRMYESYSENNFQWAVNKTSNEKKIYYIQKKYIHKLLLNIVTLELKHLFYRGISTCVPVSKKSVVWCSATFSIAKH